MRTILVIAGIVLAGATVIAVVQNNKKGDSAPKIEQPAAGPASFSEPAAPPSSATGTNPAHGIAGHRCDIPVGAPLNTAAGTSVPTQNPPVIKMNPAPVQPSPAATSAPSPGGLKINPAHGLPGHRCDIQVGAPLT